MRDLADMPGMHDVSHRAFFDREIVSRNQPSDYGLASVPHPWRSKVWAVFNPLFRANCDARFSVASVGASSVASFCASNSGSRIEDCFVASPRAYRMITPKAVDFGFSFQPDSRIHFRWMNGAFVVRMWPLRVNGARKTQITPSVTLCVTLGFSEESEAKEVAHRITINLGADKTPDWAGATPLLCTFPCPK
jgi:hypothetical protein